MPPPQRDDFLTSVIRPIVERITRLERALKGAQDTIAGGGGGGGTTSPATTSVLGIVELSHAPADSTHPVVVEDADPRVPTTGENDALQGTVGTPSNTNRFVTDSDTRVPSAGEASALIGTSGTPSGSNPYATNSDSRLSNSRAPTVHASSHGAAGSDPLSGITDAQLASPGLGVYRRLVSLAAQIASAVAAATRLLGEGTGGSATGSSTTNWPVLVPIFAADYAVSGKTTKLRLRVAVQTNNVAPAATFTFGLYPITGAGGASSAGNSTTLGTVVTGSTKAITTPAASSLVVDVTADFDLPTDGWYGVGIVQSAVIATGASVIVTAHLDLHHV
jgi:hypothetical protein